MRWNKGALENFEKMQQRILEMGSAIKGLNLRHITPYSDIAGVMRVATSRATLSIQNKDYIYKVRKKVIELANILGFKIRTRQKYHRWDNCLSGRKRDRVLKFYLALAHSPLNLFYGNALENKQLGNSPDFSPDAVGQWKKEHIDKLRSWWLDTMQMLFLEPESKPHTITDKYGKRYEAYILSHMFSRTKNHLFGNPDEYTSESDEFTSEPDELTSEFKDLFDETRRKYIELTLDTDMLDSILCETPKDFFDEMIEFSKEFE